MNLSIGLSLTRPSGPLGFNPASLFANGEEGAWYDPSDLTTLYQDAAGTTPVTGTGQPVGLMLDKSKGGVSATELVTNGTFDAGLTGWTSGGYDPATLDSGGAKIERDAVTNSALVQTNVFVVGKTYRISYDVLSGSGNTGASLLIVGQNADSVPGSYSFVHTATTTGFEARCYINNYATIDNISVRELPGNHATQSTPTARPTLAVTGTTPATLGSELVVADSGVVYRDASSSTSYLPGFSVQAGKSYVISYTVSANVGTTSATWRVNTVSNQTTLAPVSGGFNGTVTEVFSAFSSGALGLFGNAAGVDFAIDNVSVKEVLTWADPKYYLDFDGVDDSMAATFASAQAQPNTVAAGFAFDNSNAGEPVVDGTTSARHYIYKFASAPLRMFAGAAITGLSGALSGDYVALGHFNTSSSTLKVNGSAEATGNVGTQLWSGVTLGAAYNLSAHLDGRIYGFVGVNRTLTAGEIDGVESYLATKSGVTL
jgi:hypothetical protein